MGSSILSFKKVSVHCLDAAWPALGTMIRPHVGSHISNAGLWVGLAARTHAQANHHARCRPCCTEVVYKDFSFVACTEAVYKDFSFILHPLSSHETRMLVIGQERETLMTFDEGLVLCHRPRSYWRQVSLFLFLSSFPSSLPLCVSIGRQWPSSPEEVVDAGMRLCSKRPNFKLFKS